MPPEQKDHAHLWDMLEAARAVLTFTSGKSLDDYRREDMLRAAVERKIEIIGEAARRLSDAFQQAHPDIPWRKIMAQRHVLAHEYGEIDDDTIWRVVKTHIPEMIAALEKIAPPQP
jgi:uncharacterized protein with HEPN domain